MICKLWKKFRNYFRPNVTFSPAHCNQQTSTAKKQNSSSVLDKLYDNRQEFNIIALTGPMGCGVEKFTNLISSPFKNWERQVRKPDEICVNVQDSDDNPHAVIKQTIFKRKYTICYDFWKTRKDTTYRLLKYNKMLLLYSLVWISKQEDVTSKNLEETICTQLSNIIKSEKEIVEYYKDDVEGKVQSFWGNVFNGIKTINYAKLWNELNEYTKISEPFSNDIDKLKFSSFFLNENTEYAKFYNAFSDELRKKDFFIYTYLWYRMGVNVRSAGQLLKKEVEQNENLFDIIELLNIVIKKASREGEASRRFCIDSLRNSLEMRYLSERYNAFYSIALYNSESEPESIKKLVESYNKNLDEDQRKNVCRYAERLSRIEGALDDYRKGQFASLDVEQCVAQAEIHICCQEHKKGTSETSEFYSTAEQWMKFASLMLHPGLITPSSDERCMEIAYTAKFNSGCVSRQVGAVITNKSHSIRAIGWNEVPYGQISCGLRSISDIVRKDFSGYKKYMYSNFERGDSNQTNIYKDGKDFQQKLSDDYRGIIGEMEQRLNPIPPVFCFRATHNKFTGGDNQVYGRSLHAEENALMQISKDGGEGLMGGIIYVTASPCELCSRKLYQVGIRKIVYIDPYPGIAREQTITSGYMQPELAQYRGAYGATYYKLYTPLISPKDEQAIRCKGLQCGILKGKEIMEVVRDFLREQNVNIDITKSTFTKEEKNTLENYLQVLKTTLDEPINREIKEITIKVLLIILQS